MSLQNPAPQHKDKEDEGARKRNQPAAGTHSEAASYQGCTQALIFHDRWHFRPWSVVQKASFIILNNGINVGGAAAAEMMDVIASMVSVRAAAG